MEYVQMVLFQIPAGKLREASRPGGLFAALDEHKLHLETQTGFVDIRVVRSPNREGAVQVAVETRWDDADGLVHYETREPNVASVVNGYREVIAPDSLQVYDMEALRAEPAGRPVRERLALPLLVPVGAFLFAVLVIYGLSRIYLEVPTEVATGLAIGIALGILGVGSYLAVSPKVSRWQVVGIALAVVALLLGGSLFAAIHEDEEAKAEEAAVPTTQAAPRAAPAAAPGAAPAAGALNVEMGDNFFTFQGKKQPNIEVKAGEQVTVSLVNSGKAIHNLRLASLDDKYDSKDDFVSNPDIMKAGAKGALAFKLDKAGAFKFRCDFHPDEMVGTITVK